MSEENGAAPVEQAPEVLEAEVIGAEEALEVPEVPAEEPVVEGEVVETDETVEAPEPITFEDTDETPAVLEKVDKVLERYELAPELQAAFETLKAAAQVEKPDFLEPFSVYGGQEEIASLLERESLLLSQKSDETGNIRPRTDEFAQNVFETNPDRAAWLFYDLGALPSQQYEGFTQWQEAQINAYAKPGDTASAVLARYQKAQEYVMQGSLPSPDVPAFVPESLHQAFNSLSKETRDDFADLETNLDELSPDARNYVLADQRRKLAELQLIQNGLDAAAENARNAAIQKQQNDFAFNQDVQNKQEAFFSTFRNNFADDLAKTVKFSDDPKMQTMLSHQTVTLLESAFDEGSAGEFARKALQEANIPFDAVQAKTLLKKAEMATIALTTAQRAKDAQGRPLDQISLNKAEKEMESVGREWQIFAKNTLDKLAQVTSTGTQEAVKKEAQKIKVAPKARVAPKGVGTQVKKAELANPHPYGSPEYDKWWAQETLREREAQKARAYQ